MDSILAGLGLFISLFLMLRQIRGAKVASVLFLFSAVHAAYVFPKLISLAASEHAMAVYFQHTGTSTLASYMALSCFLCAVLTYRWLAPPISTQRQPKISRSAQGGLVRYAIIIGLFATIALLSLIAINGGIKSYFFSAGFYQMRFEGLNVWLLFVSRFIYVAIAAATIATLTRPTYFRACLLTFLCIGPILNILLLFRRTDLLIIAYIAVYGLIVIRGLRPKRSTNLLAGLVAALAIVSFPYLRQAAISEATGWNYGTSNTDLLGQVAETLSIGESDEVVRAASIIDQTRRSGSLQLGGFIWNSFVRQFIPSSLFGPDVKKGMMIEFGSRIQEASLDFDTQSYFYVAPMGFSQAFEQFHIFGGIIFAALAGILALCERRSNVLSNRIFVMVAVPLLCLAATNDIGSTPAGLITFWVLSRTLGRLKA